MFTLVPGSVIVGALVTRRNNYRWAICSGWALTTLASGLMVLWGVNTSIAQWAITLVILGFGHGAILNAQNFATQAMCKPGEEGSAAAMYGFLRQFGTAIGVGVGGSAFQNVMALKLSWDGLPADIAKNAEAFVGQLWALPDGAEKSAILDAYVFGFRGVYGLYAGIAGVAFFVSLLIKQYDMNKEIDTEHRLHENRVSKIFEGRLSGTATLVSEMATEGKRSVTPDAGLRVPETQ